jgi:hypothetical protein
MRAFIIAAGVLVGSTACKPVVSWQRVDLGNQSITVEFPGKPKCEPPDLSGFVMCHLGVGPMEYVAEVRRAAGPAPIRPPQGARALTVAGLPAFEVDRQLPSPPGFERTRQFRTARYFVSLTAAHPAGSNHADSRARFDAHLEDATRFLDSAQLLDAPP